MASVRVIPALEPLEDGHPRLGVALKPTSVQHLALQRGEETLGHGVVVCIASGPHRGHHPGFAAPLPKRVARVLTAAVRVVDDGLRTPLCEGHVQGREDALGLEVGLHRPPDNAPRPDIEHHGEIEKPRPVGT